MQASSHKSSPCKSVGGGRHTPQSASSEDFDDDGELAGIDGNELSDLDDLSAEAANTAIASQRKPHFLDYDYPELENPGESLKIDKSLERDGEISDHILTAAYSNEKKYKNVVKKKHFLDENPIAPPDFREHRSLDRLDERKSKQKDNYTLNRYIEKEVPNSGLYQRTWPTASENGIPCRYGSMPPTALDLEPKVECIYSLMSMLGNNTNSDEMASKFLDLSRNREACVSLRRSGCISILVQLQHTDPSESVRKKAAEALHNVVHGNDDKSARREIKVLKQIEALIEFCNFLRSLNAGNAMADDGRHPVNAIGILMKTSFDEEHRQAMCQLGALQTISTLVQLDHQAHGAASEDPNCVTLRRYAGMTLTNLTFGDGNNKALLCLNRGFMRALVSQIDSASDELVQVTASVLRNLSWRADTNMKAVLSEIGAVTILTKAAMRFTMENSLKAILSALWNLSNSPQNKQEFCECEGAIDFLIDMLLFEAPSKTFQVVENAGGILRNVSSYIAGKEEYRAVLRRRNCLGILLQQLKSSSLTVVSNASGTLGNLSANSPEDQKFLRDNGAIPMLRSLICSKHKMISNGCTLALKNLFNVQKAGLNCQHHDSVSKSLELKELPTLSARKQKAFEQELDQMTNSCSSDEVITPPKDNGHTRLIARCFKSHPPTVLEHTTKSEDSSFDNDEQPFDYSKGAPGPSKLTAFQETDLDQPKDYSKMYPFDQNQIVSDELSHPAVADQVKHFRTEDTPKNISNAASVTDLHKIAVAPKSEEGTSRPTAKSSTFTSGTQSPERPIRYCVEGTPGGLSRCDTPSDLESDGAKSKQSQTVPNTPPVPIQQEAFISTPLVNDSPSPYGSLGSLEPANLEDQNSIVSETSYLPSRVLSPTEIPDDPFESVPHSPRPRSLIRQKDSNLESTPEEPNTSTLFACVSSLSNHSLDGEPKIEKDTLSKEMQLCPHSSEEHEDENEIVLNYIEPGSPSRNQSGVELNSDESDKEEDDEVLQNAIQIGKSRSVVEEDTLQQYCTEDTPAILSKVGSASNLSCLSLETKNDDISEQETDDTVLMDEVILMGMHASIASRPMGMPQVKENPIEKMKCGYEYLVHDETNRFHVEDSPIAFSTVSALSDLTIGSGVAELAKLKGSPQRNGTWNLDGADMPSSSVPRRLIPHSQVAENCNDSLSSIESGDSESQFVFDQIVRTGIDCVGKKPGAQKEETSDDLLLQEAIQSGMNANISSSGPKNVQTTPEVGLEITTKGAASTTPGVVNHGTAQKAPTMKGQHGTNNGNKSTTTTQMRRKEIPNGNNSLNLSMDSTNLLMQSNESPALYFSGDEIVDEFPISELDISNECMFEDQENKASMEEKRTNPDLMLRSVERLTQELVATAELQLRGQQSTTKKEHDDGSNNNTWNDSNETSFPSYSGCLMNGSAIDDDNTFNDLRSSSFRLPVEIYEEITPTNEVRSFNVNTCESANTTQTSIGNEASLSPIKKEPSWYLSDDPLDEASLETTLRYDEPDIGIPDFQLGGEVHSTRTFQQPSGPFSIDSCSTMTNSTIIFMEANKVVTDLQNLSPADSLSSLDLDKIRPPSVMDCVSLSTVTCEFPSSPQMSRQRKCSIPTGIMARRALGQMGPKHLGSADNINSLAGNLDNIKPPSIMDELLDSMISVASITSEVADATSHYETALSEIDDTTLQSCCMDLTSDATPVPSDFSSNESTPKRGGIRRALTPKQKRQMAKDRYRTYTIAADMVLKERADELLNGDLPPEEDEVLEVEVTDKQKVTMRQKRKDNRGRFETQVLDTSQLHLSSASEGSESPSVRRRVNDPERYRTRTISSTSTASDHFQSLLKEANGVANNLTFDSRKSEEFLLDGGASDLSLVSNDDEDTSIKAATAHLKFLKDPRTVNLSRTNTNIITIRDDKFSSSDITSLEYEQNSETESCDQNREFSDSNDERVIRPRIVKPAEVNLDSAGDEGCSSPEPRGVRGRKKPAYVSPYRMTSRNTSPKPVAPVVPMKKEVSAKKAPPPSKLIPKNLTLIAKTHVIMNKATLTNKVNSVKSGLAKPLFGKNGRGMIKSKTYTEMSSHCETTLERQGTFVKEEGTSLDVPVVTSAPPTPAKSKLPQPKSAPSRTRTSLVSKLKNPLQKSATQQITPPQPTKPLRRFGPGVYKSPSVPTVPQRSTSNMSIGKSSPNIVKSSNNVSTVPKKDNITSRIAGLWKKVDESKKQQQGKKDTRVWIGANKKVVAAEPPPPLIRSSTFDASPENSTVRTSKESNLPVITKARTLKSPSSGNLKVDRLTTGFRRN